MVDPINSSLAGDLLSQDLDSWLHPQFRKKTTMSPQVIALVPHSTSPKSAQTCFGKAPGSAICSRAVQRKVVRAVCAAASALICASLGQALSFPFPASSAEPCVARSPRGGAVCYLLGLASHPDRGRTRRQILEKTVLCTSRPRFPRSQDQACSALPSNDGSLRNGPAKPWARQEHVPAQARHSLPTYSLKTFGWETWALFKQTLE